jgi:hypothetical protein
MASSSMAAWPSYVTSWRSPHSDATASNSRPALVVTGAFRPLRHMLATASHAGGFAYGGGAGSPHSSSHAQAMRHGSRAARSPPGCRTGHRWPARVKSVSPPTSSSPPHTVPSGP